ncbi:conjugal transfer protein TrbJ [Salmonella enterica]|nr:conjugal transfer protein TrbJ [Salmonella enterica]
MKKKFLALLLAISFNNYASGIPVVDVAAIAKTVEEGLTRAQEAANNLAQLKQQYEQSIKYAEEQKKRLEGFSNFSNGFDSASSYMKDSLDQITNDASKNLSDVRNKYNLSSDSANIQARYDATLKKIKIYEDFNDNLQSRAKRMQKLQESFATATTPQEKADLANQLNTEKLTLDMQIKQYDIAERQLTAQNEAEYEQLRKESISGMFKH